MKIKTPRTRVHADRVVPVDDRTTKANDRAVKEYVVVQAARSTAHARGVSLQGADAPATDTSTSIMRPHVDIDEEHEDGGESER